MAPPKRNPGQWSCHVRIGVAAAGEVDGVSYTYKAAQPFPLKHLFVASVVATTRTTATSRRLR